MKKRIISFLLVLVMLFSFASLNIFAAVEETDASGLAEGVAELSEAEKYQQYGVGLDGAYNLDYDALEEIVGKSNFLIGGEITEKTYEVTDAYTWWGTYAGVTGLQKYDAKAFETIKLVKRDGSEDDWYIRWEDDGNIPEGSNKERLEWENSNLMIDSETKYNTYKDKLGTSYVLTFDFMNWGESGTASDGLLGTQRFKVGATIIGVEYDVRVNGDGKLEVRDAAKSIWRTTDCSIPLNEFVQISIWHTPRGLNGIREVDENGTSIGDDNTYHVFVNGEYVTTACAVTPYYNKNYELDLSSGTVQLSGGSDYFPYMFHFGRYDVNNIAIDDIRMYYGDLVECKHDWTYSHSHNTEDNTNVLSAVCTWCGKTESETTKNVKLSKAEIDALAESNVVINTDFSFNAKNESFNDATDTGWLAPFEGAPAPFYYVNRPEFRFIVVEKNGENQYLKFQAPTNSDGTPYTETSLKGEYLMLENYKAHNAENAFSSGRMGSAYALTFDITHYGLAAQGNFIDEGTVKSYSGSSFAAVTALYNFQISEKGEISFKDAATGGYAASVAKLPAGEAVQITIYHTPRGLNGVKDIVYNAETGAYEKTAAYDDNTYHVFINGEYKATYQACAGDGTDWVHEGTHINSASDFLIANIRMGQTYKNYQKDVLALDDLRIYMGQFLECAHSDAVNGVCKYCGETVVHGYHCDICERDVDYSGLALDKNVALTDRNVELGDEIGMNVYLELSETAKADANTFVRLTGADGKKFEEYALKDLELMTDGDAVGRYKATLPLRSIDMTSEVKVELVKDGEAYGSAYTTSVAEYLEVLIERSTDEETVALAKATLNYGAYAQLYFAEHNENGAIAKNLANASLSDSDKADIDAVTADMLIENRISQTGEVQLTSATLVLTSQTKMKLYFNATSTAVVTVGDKELTKYATDNEGEYYVIIDGVNPAGLNDRVDLTITDGDKVGNVSLSVLSCVDAILYAGDAMPEALTNLAKAIYLYNVAADAYHLAKTGV